MPSTMPMRTDSDAGSVGPAALSRPTGPDRPPGQPRPASRPRLAPHVRLKFDPARQQHVLLTPETVIMLNDTGAAILELCDGQRTVAEILAALRDRYDRVADNEVRLFLADLLARRRMEVSRG
jgi:pyrroloquinoline quinone biosynthesis protein D